MAVLDTSRFDATARTALDRLIRDWAAGHGIAPPAPKTELTAANARARIDRELRRRAPIASTRASGRGIVMAVGGWRVFRWAWVGLHMLRRTGCTLPVELWHLHGGEIDRTMRRLTEPLGVRLVNASRVRPHHPARILNAWELKPYAVIHSRFRHVLLLDADNVTLIDPTSMFDSPQYQEHGAIFWPDEAPFPPRDPIWRLCGLASRPEPRVESGQLMVDNVRCRRALALTMFLNEHSDFFYQHVHGDKDTFQLAWWLTGQQYARPATPMRPLRGAMCQHDLRGRRMFQHRTAKWDDPDLRIRGFRHEDTCRGLLRRLDRLASDG